MFFTAGVKSEESTSSDEINAKKERKRTLKLIDIKAIDLCVTLGVLEQAKQEFCALDGPTTLNGAKLLRLSGPADGTVVAAEGDDLFVLLHVLEVADGLGQLETREDGGRFTVVVRVAV